MRCSCESREECIGNQKVIGGEKRDRSTLRRFLISKGFTPSLCEAIVEEIFSQSRGLQYLREAIATRFKVTGELLFQKQENYFYRSHRCWENIDDHETRPSLPEIVKTGGNCPLDQEKKELTKNWASRLGIPFFDTLGEWPNE